MTMRYAMLFVNVVLNFDFTMCFDVEYCTMSIPILPTTYAPAFLYPARHVYLHSECMGTMMYYVIMDVVVYLGKHKVRVIYSRVCVVLHNMVSDNN